MSVIVRVSLVALVSVAACAGPERQSHTTTYADHAASRGMSRHGQREAGPEPPAGSATDSYFEISATAGMGGTNDAQRIDSDGDGDSDRPNDVLVGLGGYFLARRHSYIYGASLGLSAAVFGAGHTRMGGIVGLATPGRRGHLELLSEGGLHVISHIGSDLFTTATGDSVSLPYLGAQARLVVDPGAIGHIKVAMALALRTDLGRTQSDVMTTTCFLGCTSESETWRIGGQSADVTVGLSYQFE